MIAFFKALIYTPLYNILVFLIDINPLHSVGLGVILLTVLVKLLLVPLFQKMLYTQYAMRRIQPQLNAIRDEHKDNPQEQGKKMLELYRSEKVNPFASIFLLLIQLPIVLSLYYIFRSSGLPEINTDLLYSFIAAPTQVEMVFLGINLAETSIILAILAGITSYIQVALTARHISPTTDGGNSAEKMANQISKTMKFVVPVMILVVSLAVSGAVALYFLTSNVFSIIQELYFTKFVRPRYEQQHESIN